MPTHWTLLALPGPWLIVELRPQHRCPFSRVFGTHQFRPIIVYLDFLARLAETDTRTAAVLVDEFGIVPES
jgi:hypothetical protein